MQSLCTCGRYPPASTHVCPPKVFRINRHPSCLFKLCHIPPARVQVEKIHLKHGANSDPEKWQSPKFSFSVTFTAHYLMFPSCSAIHSCFPRHVQHAVPLFHARGTTPVLCFTQKNMRKHATKRNRGCFHSLLTRSVRSACAATCCLLGGKQSTHSPHSLPCTNTPS